MRVGMQTCGGKRPGVLPGAGEGAHKAAAAEGVGAASDAQLVRVLHDCQQAYAALEVLERGPRVHEHPPARRLHRGERRLRVPAACCIIRTFAYKALNNKDTLHMKQCILRARCIQALHNTGTLHTSTT